jgi:hypothetical protein
MMGKVRKLGIIHPMAGVFLSHSSLDQPIVAKSRVPNRVGPFSGTVLATLRGPRS